MSRKRKSDKHKVKGKVLFFVEGTTEKNYFTSFFCKYDIQAARAIRIIKGSGDWVCNTARFIRNTHSDRYKLDSETKIYIIFDKDNYNNNQISEMREEAVSLKDFKKANCEVCVSNCSFEVWLLAHFEEMTPKTISYSRTWQKMLENKLTKYLGVKYVKKESTNYKLVEKIIEENRIYKAIANSKSIAKYSDTNQSTEIQPIIENLLAVAGS